MNSALKKLEKIISELPTESQTEIIDFAEFLREKERRKNPTVKPKERIFGMYEGQGWISDDFNDELPDKFWFGEDLGVIEKENESAD